MMVPRTDRVIWPVKFLTGDVATNFLRDCMYFTAAVLVLEGLPA